MAGYLYTPLHFYQILMKYLIALVLFSTLFFAAQKSNAMFVKIDSVYADSCYQDGVYGVSPGDSANMFRSPDTRFGHLTGNGPFIDLAFKKYKKGLTQPIKFNPDPQLNSMIAVWGKKDLAADSSAGQLTFNRYDENLGMLITSPPVILTDSFQIIPVPDYGGIPNWRWDYIEISLAGDFVKHATSYFIDAVALLQDTTPKVSVPFEPSAPNAITSYPNPFITNTTIHFTIAAQGEAELVIIDALGREADHINAGYFENGTHEIPLAIRTPGFYFVRLLVNGEPVGSPLKITSR